MTGALGPGWRVGHWTDADAATGCTVVLPPVPNVTSCDVRGSSPSSRELDLLHLERRLTEVHAIVLTGGSAFGLAAADGVVAWLEERGIGYRTRNALVPIVPAAVIYDLGHGGSDVRPRAEHGRSASEAAVEGPVPTGRVGAGAGATAGKWAGFEHAVAGGLGIATIGSHRAFVSALAVVNPVGDVIAPDGSVLAGTTAPDPLPRAPLPDDSELPTSTVLAVVATDAQLDKRDVRWLAARGADGVTTSVRPAHTRYDGDVVFAVSAGATELRAPELDALGRAATEAVAAAVRAAVAD